MIITILLGIIGVLSIIFLGNPKTFILLFNYIFNTNTLLDNNIITSIYIGLLIIIILLLLKNLIKIKFNIQKIKNNKTIMFFIINIIITIFLKNKILSITPLKTIIMKFIICFLILLVINKIAICNKKENYSFIFILLLFIFLTTYLNINNILIIYLIGRLFKIDHNIILKYIIIYLSSYSIGFIIINNFNFSLYALISSIITSLYLYFNYYKFNYAKLRWFYFILSLFLLYYFR